MKKILCAVLMVLSISVNASEESKHKKLVELIDVMEMEAMMDAMYSQMELMMKNMSNELGIQPSEQETYDSYYSKMTNVMRDTMGWEKMEPLTLEIYDKNFNEQEISDMLEFYKSDTGKALIAKTPIVMQESMQLSQSFVQETLPKIQEIHEELSQELQELREKKE